MKKLFIVLLMTGLTGLCNASDETLTPTFVSSLGPEMRQSLTDKLDDAHDTKTPRLPLIDVMLYGPPGVGKKMVAAEYLGIMNEQELIHEGILLRDSILRDAALKRRGKKVEAALAQVFRYMSRHPEHR